MKITNKKGAIGATLTWMVAIFIILFILIVFLVFVAALFVTKGKIEIKPEDSTKTNFLSSSTLMFIINMPIELNGEKMAMKDALRYWSESSEKGRVKKEIEIKIQENLDSLLGKNEGYIFYIAYSGKNIEIKDGINQGGFVQIDGAEDYIALSNNFYMDGVATEANSALKRASTIYLLGDKQFKIRIYIGRVK